jgi:hypothetical protein
MATYASESKISGRGLRVTVIKTVYTIRNDTNYLRSEKVDKSGESVGSKTPGAGFDFRVSSSLMSSCQAFEFCLVAKGFSRSA